MSQKFKSIILILSLFFLLFVPIKAFAAEFAEYFPVDPLKFGIKTYEWTFGKSGQVTSSIEGVETVPYLSGDISGSIISNWTDLGSGIVSNDGVNVKYLGVGDYYISTDCSLTDHSSVWSFSTLNDGDIIDQSASYAVNKNNFLDCDGFTDQNILISIQDVTVLKGNFQNAIIMWYIDENYTFEPLNFFGKESDLGITLPTTTGTGGLSVTAFEIYGFDTGPIAEGDVDADTGNLVDLRELLSVIKGYADELAVDFGASGLWHYDGLSWTSLAGLNPDGMGEWTGGLAVNFGATYGLWNYDGTTWSQLAAWESENSRAWNNDLIIDFGPNGLWQYDGTSWTGLAPFNPDNDGMATWSGGLAVDFGAAYGLWNHDGTTWSQLAGWEIDHNGVAWNNGLAVDFGINGLWYYDGTSWANLTGLDPEGMVEWAGGLAVDFGDTYGLFNYDGTTWSQLAGWNPDDMVKWADGLAVDFGVNGLGSYDGTTWSLIAGLNPEEMEAWGSGLSVDFGVTYGLWNYDGSSWINLAGSDSEEIEDINVFRNYQIVPNDPNLKYHTLKFFIAPNLASVLSTNEVQSFLQQYANEINNIFSKQTLRRFNFDPAVDIILTDTNPFSSNASPPIPEEDYEMWIYAVLTDNPTYGTYGGYMGLDISGAGGANGLRWDAIHDPSTLIDGSEELEQYWRQIDHIVHEFEHTFGAGAGEYYSMNIVDDMTGVEPILNIDLWNNGINDPFWGQHLDYFSDPLTANIWNNNLLGNPTNLKDLRDLVLFANVTVAVVNQGPRNNNTKLNTVPDLSEVIIRVYDSISNLLLNNSTVKVWNVKSVPPYDANELTVTNNALGDITFTWVPYPHISIFGNFDQLKLIKVSSPGYRDAAKWVSIFDCQEEKIVNGNDNYIISIYLEPI